MTKALSVLLICLVGFALVAPPAVAQTDAGDALATAAGTLAAQMSKATETKRGEVAAVDEGPPVELYVTLGTNVGVVEGTFLSIVSKGDPIVVGGQTVGFKESPVGIAQVTRVQNEQLCVATMASVEAGKQPSAGCGAYARTVPSSLALTSFERSDRQIGALGQEFADKLMISLQQTGRFRLQERTRFEAVLAEMSLGLNDLFNPEKAVPLGQQLQAKGIVVGTISQRDDRYEVQARVIDVETGTIVATALSTFGRSGYCDDKYDTIVGAGTATTSTIGTTATMTAGPVRLFDALEPIDGQEPVAMPLGTVSIGGKLYDDCIGYGPFGVHYDLKRTNWTELRVRLGHHDRDTQWRNAVVRVQCDGRLIIDTHRDTGFDWGVGEQAELRVPLAGIRQMSIFVQDMGYGPRDGIVAIEDFTLIGRGGQVNIAPSGLAGHGEAPPVHVDGFDPTTVDAAMLPTFFGFMRGLADDDPNAMHQWMSPDYKGEWSPDAWTPAPHIEHLDFRLTDRTSRADGTVAITVKEIIRDREENVEKTISWLIHFTPMDGHWFVTHFE